MTFSKCKYTFKVPFKGIAFDISKIVKGTPVRRDPVAFLFWTLGVDYTWPRRHRGVRRATGLGLEIRGKRIITTKTTRCGYRAFGSIRTLVRIERMSPPLRNGDVAVRARRGVVVATSSPVVTWPTSRTETANTGEGGGSVFLMERNGMRASSVLSDLPVFSDTNTGERTRGINA